MCEENGLKRAIIVWGTSSGAGKSLFVTALCRWAALQGVRVAPFKAQNMSNNARVVHGTAGRVGEMGSAQYFQALAARLTPVTKMNPVLLKPEKETVSQVIVNGQVDHALSAMPWRERSTWLAASAKQSFDSLADCYDLLVIEGAGSPAEINLAAQDFVNLEVARWARTVAPLSSILITDIDRGGAFAHLYGTWALLPTDLRASLAGFVLNKFRGDPALLAPGPQQLQALTGMPVLGVLPMLYGHGLPEEDGIYARLPKLNPSVTRKKLQIAVLAYPYISNLDEFHLLAGLPDIELVWARNVQEARAADWIVLPGSKQVSRDLHWLRNQGLDQVVVDHASADRPVLGICGGLQMLGQRLADPRGYDGQAYDEIDGLGLLPISTVYQATKQLLAAQACFGELQGRPWAALSRTSFAGYEIHVGMAVPQAHAAGSILHASGRAIGWQAGSVLGIYSHGLFENHQIVQRLFGHHAMDLETVFDRLAQTLNQHMGAELQRLLQDIATPHAA